jgi:hypothetical protein
VYLVQTFLNDSSISKENLGYVKYVQICNISVPAVKPLKENETKLFYSDFVKSALGGAVPFGLNLKTELDENSY